MAVDSAEQLETLLWQCIVDEFQAYQNRLEIRIANVLRIQSNLGEAPVVAIATAVSRDMEGKLVAEAFRSGQLKESLRKLL